MNIGAQPVKNDHLPAIPRFTAQSLTVSALMQLFARFDRHQMSQGEMTTIVVFMAFAIEAYLNSIGARKVKFWDDLERLPWKQKIAILHKNIEAEPNWGTDPLQLASEVFKLRENLLMESRRR